MQRVSDQGLSNRIRENLESPFVRPLIDCDIALDLRDARAEVERLKAERRALVEALKSLPMREFADALADGCDANGAWDCVSDAVDKHVREALARVLAEGEKP